MTEKANKRGALTWNSIQDDKMDAVVLYNQKAHIPDKQNCEGYRTLAQKFIDVANELKKDRSFTEMQAHEPSAFKTHFETLRKRFENKHAISQEGSNLSCLDPAQPYGTKYGVNLQANLQA